jgi:hypothetical protein
MQYKAHYDTNGFRVAVNDPKYYRWKITNKTESTTLFFTYQPECGCCSRKIKNEQKVFILKKRDFQNIFCSKECRQIKKLTE